MYVVIVVRDRKKQKDSLPNEFMIGAVFFPLQQISLDLTDSHIV